MGVKIITITNGCTGRGGAGGVPRSRVHRARVIPGVQYPRSRVAVP